jgi:hypothetical protein
MDDLALLQHLVEVDGVFRHVTRGVCFGMVVMLGSLDLDALNVMFHSQPQKGALGIRKSILPRSNGAYTSRQAGINATTRRKPKQPLVRSKTPPG